MAQPRHRVSIRNWLAGAALLSATALSMLGLAPTATNTANAAAPPPFSQAPAQQQTQPTDRHTRRESVVPSNDGAAPRTGSPSVFRPLDLPNWGTNQRANTDTQSPNRAQQEPSIAVNPTNPLNIVAAAKDERGGVNTKQIWIYTSTDGGSTWINQQFPLRAPQSPYSSDPVVKFDDDGLLYVTALPYGGGAAGIQVSRSTDGGITFLPATQVTTNGNADKEWMWVDNYPSSPYYHRVYVAWMDFSPGFRVTYSTDRGLTWTVSSAGPSAYQFPMPIVYPNGDVQTIYMGFSSYMSIRSTDGGVTWANPTSLVNYVDANCPPDNPGCSIWRLNSVPVIAVNRNNGNAVTVWADGGDGTATIRFSRGSANGTVWTASQVLAAPGVANTYQVEPWVEADENGTFHAIWYDDRENPNTSIFNIYYSQSTDDGATWSTAVRISTATSDLRIGIPSSYAQAAGDYINVTAAQGNVYAVWTDTRSGTGEDIYVVRGTFGGTPTPTITPGGPTFTPVPPTSTRTSTPVPPTATLTNTPVPPTNTPLPPTSTTVPPTGTLTTVPTDTPGAPTNTPAATATATSCPIQFTDVPEGSTFYTNIRCLACRGIINGYPDNTFRPNNDVTRGQLAKIVSNSVGFSDPAGTQMFEDVLPGSTFYDFVQRLASRGYIVGYTCGGAGEPCGAGSLPYFRPANNATRGQISKIVSNAAGFTEPAGAQLFEDVLPGSTFYDYIERLASRNVITGYPCGNPGEPCGAGSLPYFRPNASASRGQTSKIVSNTFFSNCDPFRRK
ncbi:MAG: S-layer homology domain-containing protein [Chloroflexota bacterium]